MKKFIVLVLLLMPVFMTSGCGKDVESLMMITPLLQRYEASKDDLAYLEVELSKLMVHMNQKDIDEITASYYALSSAIEYVKTLAVNGQLTVEQASTMWGQMKNEYVVIIKGFDYYQPQMSVPVRLVYNSTKQSAAAGAREFDNILKLVEEGDLGIGTNDLMSLVVNAGKSLLPMLLAL